VLDTHLGARPYIVGDKLTIADLSACGYLFFDDELAVDWNRYPGVRDWLARIREEPRWKHPYELLPGHPIPGRK
jgi:glutathione S-transferase